MRINSNVFLQKHETTYLIRTKLEKRKINKKASKHGERKNQKL